ncbi:MAG TPA: hypothetical protein VJ892_03765 [Candidatus Absconditabacterales bacterium]|nr:hypothetical protein [Candidatus Absconditabacterales bacterium]
MKGLSGEISLYIEIDFSQVMKLEMTNKIFTNKSCFMKLKVDKAQRFAKMRAHTATHLLHAELSNIFPNTKQAGSLVDDNLLRFDFQAERMLTNQELTIIEKNINDLILQALPVLNQEMSLEEAQKQGAKAFFEEKYGDTVRVISINTVPLIKGETGGSISTELCGGTHVENTRDIGSFVIVNQEAVASGIKRISAYTGPKVLERILEMRDVLHEVQNKLGVKAENQILDKIEKELKEKELMESKFESINTKLIIENLKSVESKSNKIFDKIINVSEIDSLKDISFKDVVFQAKGLFQNIDLIIYNNEGGFAIITSKSDSSAKTIAKDLDLRGGGSDLIVQGKDSKVLELFN